MPRCLCYKVFLFWVVRACSAQREHAACRAWLPAGTFVFPARLVLCVSVFMWQFHVEEVDVSCVPSHRHANGF